MTDKIWGKVTEVVDGDTFLLEVAGFDQLNVGFYENEVKVCIDWITSEDLRRDMIFKSKEELGKKLLGKSVTCTVADSGWEEKRKWTVQLSETRSTGFSVRYSSGDT